MINLRQLQHALALREHSSFGKAAKSCNISQPAFSRSIQQLEKSLGTRLFDRRGGVIEPTNIGESVLSRAAVISNESYELEREVVLLKGLEFGNLVVAVGTNAAEISGAKAIGMLMQQYPAITSQILVLGWRQVMDQILSQHADVGLAEIGTAELDERIQVEPVAAHPVRFYCRSKHPLYRRKRLAIADLGQYPLVGSRLPPRVAGCFFGGGSLDALNGDFVPAIESDEPTMARNIVRQSNAISYAAIPQLCSWPDREDFHILPVIEPWMQLNYGFISLKNRTLSPAALKFMELVLAAEAELG